MTIDIKKWIRRTLFLLKKTETDKAEIMVIKKMGMLMGRIGLKLNGWNLIKRNTGFTPPLDPKEALKYIQLTSARL